MRRFAALALLALASCSGGIDPDTARIEVERLVKAYHKAYDGAEVDNVLGMLDAEVCIPNPPSSFFTGREQCGAALKEGMEKIRARDKIGKRSTYLGDIRVVIEGKIAVATYDAKISEEGSAPSRATFTRVFRYSDGKWRILSEHYSYAPDK
jgi:ketosteroid isomerase-like protein